MGRRAPPRLPRSCSCVVSLWLDVTTESLAHCGQDLLGKGVLSTRAKTRVQRSRQDLGRNRLGDCRFNGPAPLAGILDEARIGIEVCVPREGGGGQVEKPRRDDAATPPHFRN